jgi:beta-glucosidase
VGLACALLAVGCTSDDAAEPSTSTTSTPSQQAAADDRALESRVDAVLASMTLEEKVGQTVQADIGSVTPEDVRRHHLGSVLAGGDSDPDGQVGAPPERWLELADEYWAASVDRRDGAAGVPILFGIDAVHGNNNVVGATLFPHNIGLGATRNPDLVRRIGAATAAEVRATGMEWTFAPTVAVPQNLRWGRTYEGYGEEPELAATLGPAMVEGLQGTVGSDDFLDDRHVLATLKHFVGDGGTTDGFDQGDTDLSDEELLALHGAGYPPGIAVGAQTVMASFNSVRGEKVHGSRELLTDVLRGRLDFGGFVVGDWNGHGQVEGCTDTDCVAAFAAGMDMAMAPASWKGYLASMLRHVRAGDVSEERLDEAVRRILRVKLRMGLFEAPAPSERALGGDLDLLGAPEHRVIARQAVRESLVLLKNAGGVLPIDPAARVLVAGSAADDVGRQAGGWTLTWQGVAGDRSVFPNAQTIWEGLEEQILAAGGTAELAPDGRATTKPDVAVVVFGERPYAEGFGDVASLAPDAQMAEDLATVERLHAQGIPVVSVLLSGRPLWMTPTINDSDAFVAAWLPGSEGGGVADVLLADVDGRPQHQPVGSLSFTWPATPDAASAADRRADPLFPVGYGLDFDDDGGLDVLSEGS